MISLFRRISPPFISRLTRKTSNLCVAPNAAMTDILPDLLGYDLAIVFCGTAASAVSARKRAYYANPSNRFWSALYASGITPRLFHPDEFRELLDLRIGLTGSCQIRIWQRP